MNSNFLRTLLFTSGCTLLIPFRVLLVFAVLMGFRTASAQDLYVGSNTSGNSTNFTSGTNSYSSIIVGYTANASNNMVLVEGGGTVLDSSGQLFIGYSGDSNSLTISNAGIVSNSQGYIGYSSAAVGNSVIVTGSNSLWSNQDILLIGSSGSSNSLVISNGGSVSSFFTTVGDKSSNNAALITDNGSVWSNNDLKIGVTGGNANTLVISNGGKVVTGNQNGYVGINASSNSAVVTGINSLWTNRNALYVGSNGTGNSLVISNGGTVATLNGGAIIGINGSNNTAIVTGNGSLWTNSLSLYVGSNGSGNSLVISEGARVTNGGGFTGGDFIVGSGGSNNSLLVSAGGQAMNVTGRVGWNGSGNSAVVTGANTLWSNSGSFFVGDNGNNNSLVISSGGTVASKTALIGSQSTNNSVLVTGVSSTWRNQNTLYVGTNQNNGHNSLVISNGASVISGDVQIGYLSSYNSVVVTGSNSLLNSPGTLTMGWDGGSNGMAVSNSMTISSGGRVLGGSSVIIGSGGEVLVSGVNSLWSNSGVMRLGGQYGLLNTTVADGGVIAASQIILSYNGYYNPSVAATLASLNIGALGSSDTGGLIISPNIVFASERSVINFNQSNNTTLSSAISGAGSIRQLGIGTSILSGNNSYSGLTLISAGALQVGNGGATGTLGSGMVANYSSLILNRAGILNLSNEIAGFGSIIQLGTGTSILSGYNTYEGTTTISAGALQVGNGGVAGTLGRGNVVNNASLIIKRSDTVNLSNRISGTGSFTQAGDGTTILSADNTFQGATYVNAGTLLINAANTSSRVTVNSGATLGGSGSLGDVTIQSGGILAPGNSPGHLDVASLTLTNGSILNFEVTGTNASQYDSIYADRGFVFGGTLNISVSGIYDSTNNIGLFELFRSGSGTIGGINNNFQAVTLSGTYAGSLTYYAGNNLWQIWDGANSYVGLDMTTGILTVIPEPSTYALLALGLLVVVTVIRRKKSA